MNSEANCIMPPAGNATSPPTILQVLPSLETGGVERGTLDIAKALKEAGWRPIVASSGGTMVHELERIGVDHFVMPLNSKNPYVIRRNIARLRILIEVPILCTPAAVRRRIARLPPHVRPMSTL